MHPRLLRQFYSNRPPFISAIQELRLHVSSLRDHAKIPVPVLFETFQHLPDSGSGVNRNTADMRVMTGSGDKNMRQDLVFQQSLKGRIKRAAPCTKRYDANRARHETVQPCFHIFSRRIRVRKIQNIDGNMLLRRPVHDSGNHLKPA